MPAGRPNKYETNVLPNIERIKEMASAGCTNKEIADALGVSISSFCDYQTKYPELLDAVSNARIKGVSEVKQALFKKAVGFKYEETKKVQRKDEDGNNVITMEITEKQSLPDSNAIQMYLRNYDPEWLDKDQTTTKFKEMELELKKKAAESEVW